jgi:uncharacterized membrane protein
MKYLRGLRRISALAAGSVLCTPVHSNAQITLDRIETQTGSGIEIQVVSPYETPTSVFIPLQVIIVNHSARDGEWKVSVVEPGVIAGESSEVLRVPAGSTREFPLLLPLLGQSTSSYNAQLYGRVEGPGIVGEAGSFAFNGRNLIDPVRTPYAPYSSMKYYHGYALFSTSVWKRCGDALTERVSGHSVGVKGSRVPAKIFPKDVRAYFGVSLIVLDSGDLEVMSAAQCAALAEWVAQGGSLGIVDLAHGAPWPRPFDRSSDHYGVGRISRIAVGADVVAAIDSLLGQDEQHSTDLGAGREQNADPNSWIGAVKKTPFEAGLVTGLVVMFAVLIGPVNLFAATRAVILNNVAAHQLPPDFLATLAFAVKYQGAGLLMCGGSQSFGSGGYFASKIDEILPVSMELKRERKKLATALVIAMDRSGSMAVGVPGGGTKMDLADRGAARAIELLGDQDAVSVSAVDSVSHLVVPLTIVGPNRAEIISRTRRIESEGGGIYVYEALSKAWQELRKASLGQRHIILFADAADSEEPGDYKKLVGEITSQGAAITVIALGTEGDQDAGLLKSIAALGNGRIYFETDAATLPELFAQETVAIARSAFITDPASFAPLPAWTELGSGVLNWPRTVDAYNLSYLKPDASVAAVTSDDDEPAPLIAFWTRGQGRVATVSFPVAGKHSETVRAWSGIGDLLQTIGRWIAAPEMPPGVTLKTRLDGTRLTIDLHHDASWESRLRNRPPRLATGSARGEVSEHTWTRIAPGQFTANIDLAEDETIRGAVAIEEATFPFGPLSTGGESEWRFDPTGPQELAALSERTGGRELLQLRDAWRRPESSRPSRLQPLLTLILAILIPIEILHSRWAGISVRRNVAGTRRNMRD